MMKQLFTLVALMSACLLQAQAPFGFANDTQPVAVLPANAADELQINFELVNLTDSTIMLDAAREYLVQAAGQESFFCWDLCYGVTANENLDPVEIAAGDTTTFGLYITLVPNGVNGITEVKMTFKEHNGPFTLDRVYAFNVGNVSSLDLGTQASLSLPYPNPANQRVSIDYRLPTSAQGAHVRVQNLLGKVMQQQQIRGTEGSMSFDIETFAPGIYFLTLWSGDQAVLTRKFTVNR